MTVTEVGLRMKVIMTAGIVWGGWSKDGNKGGGGKDGHTDGGEGGANNIGVVELLLTAMEAVGWGRSQCVRGDDGADGGSTEEGTRVEWQES